jgi:uroporphyrinogen decarboxylase
MNSKERVLNALQHRTTDRIPAARCHGFWTPEVRQSLMTRFKLRGEDTLDALLNFDVQWLETIYRGPDLGLDDQGRPIGIWGLPEGVYTYSQQFSRPLANVQSIAQIEAYRWPGVEWFDFSTVRTLAERYQDYALVAPRSWSPIFSRIADLCGFENALMFLHTESALIEAMVEKITEFNCAFYSNLLDAAPGLIDILLVGDDPAGQDKMLMNPIVWRRLFKPALKRIFEVAKSRGVMVMYHICGNCRAIIPDLIEIGMDVLMPLQISARDMDPSELKQEFGRDISFWGGVDVQQFLPTASPDQVRQEVRRLIDILGKNGGYVLSSSHNLLTDIPLDNILAMYDEAMHYYPFS